MTDNNSNSDDETVKAKVEASFSRFLSPSEPFVDKGTDGTITLPANQKAIRYVDAPELLAWALYKDTLDCGLSWSGLPQEHVYLKCREDHKVGLDNAFKDGRLFLYNRSGVLVASSEGLDPVSDRFIKVEDFASYANVLGVKVIGSASVNVKPEEPLITVGYNEKSSNLLALNQAHRLFWEPADRDDKTTWPDTANIVTFLKGKGFSDSLAKKGATIIRPDWAESGRRPEEK